MREPLIRAQEILAARGQTAFQQIPLVLLLGDPDAGQKALLNAVAKNVKLLGSTSHYLPQSPPFWWWWVFEKVVAIETTSGLVRGVGAPNDGKQWDEALTLLRQYRRAVPLNGVLALISVSLLRGPRPPLQNYCLMLERRIREAANSLRLHMPVYVVVTHCERLRGFAEFTAIEGSDRQCLGQTFAPGEAQQAKHTDLLAALFEPIRARIRAQHTLRTAEGERTQSSRLVEFAQGVEQLPAGLELVLETFGEGTRAQGGFLRGIYLVGTDERRAFVPDLFDKIVPGDQVLVRRTLRVRAAAGSVASAVRTLLTPSARAGAALVSAAKVLAVLLLVVGGGAVFLLASGSGMPLDQLMVATGGAIVCLLLVQALLMFASSLQRFYQGTVYYRHTLAHLRARVEIAQAQQGVEEEKRDRSWPGVRRFIVQRKVRETTSITSLYLVPEDKLLLPPFRPGQYLTFSLNLKGHVKPVVRCYSLSDAPNSEYFRVSIKKLPGGLVSTWAHDALEEGAVVEVKAPHGHFCLDLYGDRPVVLLAGGVGITPILSMINGLVDVNSMREVWCFYAVHNGAEHPWKIHLQALAERQPNLHLHVCYSRPREQDRQGRDFHHGERISVDLLNRVLPSNNFDFYLCGPAAMMESLVHGLKEWGVPDKNVFFEAFGPASVRKASATAVASATAAAYEVRFARAGKGFPWDPGAASLLEFAEQHGVGLDFGCRAGNCGTCAVVIRSGDVQYLHEPGTDIDEGSCLACIAVPKSNLVLDA